MKMEDLRAWMALPGIKNVSTYIQSGNILFDSVETDMEKLRLKIEKKLLAEMGKQIDVVVRCLPQMEAIVTSDPFAGFDPGFKNTTYVCFMQGEADKARVKELEALGNEEERFKVKGSEMYYNARKDTVYKSIYTPALTEKKLGLKSTNRNMNTCVKLVELMKK
jgi:uncharacterized protein (DUF1697 family)